jgi:predicted methyltransferase MtxX (methanogen marker protein 4)
VAAAAAEQGCLQNLLFRCMVLVGGAPREFWQELGSFLFT